MTTFSSLTLTNGYNSGANSWPKYYGSGFYTTVSTTLADSRVVCCPGREGAVSTSSGELTLERCFVADNACSRYLMNSSRFVGCVIRDNVVTQAYAWLYSGTLLGCTVYMADATGDDVTFDTGNIYNTVFVHLPGIKAAAVGRGCVFDRCAGKLSGFTHSTTGSVCVARPSADDWRLAPNSVAWGAAETNIAAYVDLIGTDYYGTPMLANGTIAASGAAVTRTPTAVGFEDPDGRLAVAGIPVDANDIRTGETVTVAINPDSKRPAPAFLVILNGVTNRYAETETYSISYDSLVAAGGAVTVQAVESSDWYVNANQDPEKGIVGSDDNTGFSAYFPKRSMKGGVALAVSGDTVHAAEGDYDYLTMNAAGSGQPARVEVPAGVRLVADGAREKTIIRGHIGSGAHGLGTGAVRCVYLGQGASLVGFTVTDGYMVSTGTDTNTKDAGGAVCAYHYGGTDVCITDCVLTNCASMRLVVLAGTFRRCTFVDCRVYRQHFTRASVFYNTLFTRNVMGDGTSGMNNYSSFENCTYAGDNVWTNGVVANGKLTYSPNFVRNSIVYGEVENIPAMNCIFVRDYACSGKDKLINCQEMSTADVALDADFRPIFGKSKLIDRGTNDCDSVRNYATWGGLDLGGSPRVSNGRIDVGAFEADWRGQYTADVCRRSTVTEASPSVVETTRSDGKKGVSLGADGTLLVACDRGAGETSRCRFKFEVTGSGVLTVEPEGGSAQTFTYAEGLQTCIVRGTGPQNVRFTYAPGEDDAGTAELLRASPVGGFAAFLK